MLISDDQGLGFKEHLGYGQTDITIGSIKGEKLHLYVTKDSKNNPTGYYITSKGEASLKDKYNIAENLYEIASDNAKFDELIGKLERNFYRIKWDLPNIHAIKTVEKTETWIDEKGNHHKDPSTRSEVLITDREEKIKEQINSSSTGQPTKTWTAALPWASPEFEISGDKRDSEEPPKEQKLMYKALHGEISDETEKDGISPADRKILNDIDTHAKKTLENGKTGRDLIVEKEKEILKSYYDSDSYIRKEYKRKYTKYTKQVKDEISKIRGGTIQKEKLFSSIADFLGRTLQDLNEKRNKLQSIVHNAIRRGLGNLGFGNLLKGKHKIFINGDLYLQGNSFTNKGPKPNEDSVPVSVELLEKIEDPNKIQCDLKVYAIQSPDQASEDNNPQDKEILVTDDSSLVAKRIKDDGWKALPWTQTGIELRNNEIALQGLNNIIDEFANKQKELEGFTRNALEGKLLEQDKKVIINNKRNDIFKQLNDQFANSLKKLPGWDKLEIGMDVKVPKNREVTIYSDKEGIYYVTNSDSTKLTRSGTELQRQDLSGLNPSMLDDENVWWAVPEIHAMRKFESDAEGKLHTKIILTNDKDRYKQDSWEHLGTCDLFFSSKIEIIEKTFLNICRAEYKKMRLYYYQQYDLHKKIPDEKTKIERVNIKFEEHKNQFKGLLKDDEMKDIEMQVIKERGMRIYLPNGEKSNKGTSRNPNEHVDNGSTSKVGQVNDEQNGERRDQSDASKQPTLKEGKEAGSRIETPKVANGSTSEVSAEKKNGEVKESKKDDNPQLSLENLKKSIKEELAVTRAYYNLFSHAKMQIPNADNEYLNPEKIGNLNTEDVIRDYPNDFLEKVINHNQNLKKLAQAKINDMDFNSKEGTIRKRDLNLFQSAIRDAIYNTRLYGSLVMPWYRPHKINFDKDKKEWLRNGIGSLGIEPNQFKNICEELLTDKNKYVLEIIDTPMESTNINKIAMDCPKDELLSKYESLIRAQLHLRVIFDQLKNGISVEKPESFDGRQIVITPPDGMNCLIYSLIAVSNPGLLEQHEGKFTFGNRRPIIDAIVNTIRQHLVDKKRAELEGTKGLSNEERQKQLNQEQNRPLNTGPDLDEIIKVMDGLNLINHDRNLLVYEWRPKDGTLLCTAPLSRAKNCQNPYAVFLTNHSDPKIINHFEAMISPEEKGLLTTGGQEYARIAGFSIENGMIKDNDNWTELTSNQERQLAARIKDDLKKYEEKNHITNESSNELKPGENRDQIQKTVNHLITEQINIQFKDAPWKEGASNLLIEKVGECLKIAGLVETNGLDTLPTDSSAVKEYINNFIDNLGLGYNKNDLKRDPITVTKLDESIENKWEQDVSGNGVHCLIRALLVASGYDMGEAYSKERAKFECIVKYVRIACGREGQLDINGEEGANVVATLRNLTVKGEHVIDAKCPIVIYKRETRQQTILQPTINQDTDTSLPPYEITHEGEGINNGHYRAIEPKDPIKAVPDGEMKI